jgi:hypothetical protein
MTDFPAAGIKPSHELTFQLNRSMGAGQRSPGSRPQQVGSDGLLMPYDACCLWSDHRQDCCDQSSLAKRRR